MRFPKLLKGGPPPASVVRREAVDALRSKLTFLMMFCYWLALVAAGFLTL